MRTGRTIEELNPKELAFCQFYTALGESTCGNAGASATKAGYSDKSIHTAAWRLMQRPVIREKIREIHSERMNKHLINPSRILYDLEHTRLRALAKDDLSTAARCSELMGKHYAMFSDRVIAATQDEVEELTEEQAAEARRIAQIRLRESIDEECNPGQICQAG